MDVRWFSHEPLRYDDRIDLPEFYITSMTADFCNGTYLYAITETSGSRLGKYLLYYGNQYDKYSNG